jgi:hypothetical protein
MHSACGGHRTAVKIFAIGLVSAVWELKLIDDADPYGNDDSRGLIVQGVGFVGFKNYLVMCGVARKIYTAN